MILNNNTLNYYNNCADEFYQNTVTVEFTTMQNLFLAKLKKNAYILDFGCGSELKSPPVFFGKGECKDILLDAEFEGEIAGEVIIRLYEGLDEKNNLKLSDHLIPFAISGNGKRAIHSLDISAAPDCFLGFSLRFANSGHINIYSINIK